MAFRRDLLADFVAFYGNTVMFTGAEAVACPF
jgi:hypothetical protein